MTVRVHDRIRLIAVVLNVGVLPVSFYVLGNTVQAPWRLLLSQPERLLSQPESLLIAFLIAAGSFAPVFALVAIMVKPTASE